MVYVKGISYIFVVMSRVVYRDVSLLLLNKSKVFDETILIFVSLIQDDCHCAVYNSYSFIVDVSILASVYIKTIPNLNNNYISVLTSPCF